MSFCEVNLKLVC